MVLYGREYIRWCCMVRNILDGFVWLRKYVWFGCFYGLFLFTKEYHLNIYSDCALLLRFRPTNQSVSHTHTHTHRNTYRNTQILKYISLKFKPFLSSACNSACPPAAPESDHIQCTFRL